jgi:transposase-like protein
MARTGRKPKLSPELTEKICKLLRDGNFLGPAARACGVSDATVYKWMRAGEDDAAEYEGTPLTPERHDEFRAFRAAVLEAQAMAETLLVGVIRKAAFEVKQDPATGQAVVVVKDWQAARSLLSMRFRKRWAPDVEVTEDELPAGAIAAKTTTRTVIFGGRYGPDGTLRTPAIVQPSAVKGVLNGEVRVADSGASPNADAGGGRVSEPQAEPGPKMPDV